MRLDAFKEQNFENTLMENVPKKQLRINPPGVSRLNSLLGPYWAYTGIWHGVSKGIEDGFFKGGPAARREKVGHGGP
jgi:hypothetical protein